MRRALNILQSAHTAYEHITEDSIYKCTGSPTPSDTNNIFNWLVTCDFSAAYSSK